MSTLIATANSVCPSDRFAFKVLFYNNVEKTQNNSGILNYIEYNFVVPMKKQSTKPPTNSADTKLIGIWVPKSLLRQLDAVVKKQDSDRSKVVRESLRTALDRTA